MKTFKAIFAVVVISIFANFDVSADPTYHIKTIYQGERRPLVIRIDPGVLYKMPTSAPTQGVLPIDLKRAFQVADLHARTLLPEYERIEIVELSIDSAPQSDRGVWFYTFHAVPFKGHVPQWKEGRYFALMPDESIIDASK